MLLPLVRLHSVRQHVTQYPAPSWSTKMEAGREYREAPATAVTLTLPLWSLNLDWLNELPIWEALVTVYWCVHACVCAHVWVCEMYCDNKIQSRFFPLSVSLHFCPTTSLSQSTQKFNKLLHRHWSFSHPNICIRKKKSVRWGAGWDSAVCSF